MVVYVLLVPALVFAIGFGLGRLDDHNWAAVSAGFMFLLGIALSPMGSSWTDKFACDVPSRGLPPSPLKPAFDFGPSRPPYEEQQATYAACIESLNEAGYLVVALLVVGFIGWITAKVMAGE